MNVKQLNVDQLETILRLNNPNADLVKWNNYFTDRGKKLDLDDKVYHIIAQKAHGPKGARGIQTALNQLFTPYVMDIKAQPDKIHITETDARKILNVYEKPAEKKPAK